jgi:hypothetical protein
MKRLLAIFFIFSVVLFSGCTSPQNLAKATSTTLPVAEVATVTTTTLTVGETAKATSTTLLVDEKAPAGSGFSLYFSHVISGDEYLLDTRAGTYTTHSCSQGGVQEVIIPMKLSDTDMATIRVSALKNRLLELQGNYTENCDSAGCVSTQPSVTNTVILSMDGVTKKIVWSSDYVTQDDPDLARLKAFLDVVETVISSNMEKSGANVSPCMYE